MCIIVLQLTSVNLKHVDVILITSYQTMLALPYITEFTEFAGIVYATEPTVQFARHYIDEMLEYIERTPKTKEANRWKAKNVLMQLPLVVGVEGMRPHLWKKIYNAKQVSNCFSKVKAVSYNEKLDIFGAFEVQAVSSGYLIGSCNWVIKTNHEKIVYVSSTSTLSTHSTSIDRNPIRNADLLILNNLSQTPLANPDLTLGELFHNVSKFIDTRLLPFKLTANMFFLSVSLSVVC